MGKIHVFSRVFLLVLSAGILLSIAADGSGGGGGQGSAGAGRAPASTPAATPTCTTFLRFGNAPTVPRGATTTGAIRVAVVDAGGNLIPMNRDSRSDVVVLDRGLDSTTATIRQRE